MFIIRLNRKEKHSYEEDNKHYITGIGKNIEIKRIPVRPDHGNGHGRRNDIRCVCVSGELWST